MTFPTPPIDPAYLALIRSSRVSPKLRAILMARAEPDDPAYAPRVLAPAHLRRLRAVLARVVPQAAGQEVDLAARIDAALARGEGNGWRHEALPADSQAYRDALEMLADVGAGQSFEALDEAAQDRLLGAMAGGAFPASSGAPLDAAAMALWFEDLRSDAVRLYAGHPATMARIGYSGIANGGEGGAGFTGFSKVGVGEREDFEPAAPRTGDPS